MSGYPNECYSDWSARGFGWAVVWFLAIAIPLIFLAAWNIANGDYSGPYAEEQAAKGVTFFIALIAGGVAWYVYAKYRDEDDALRRKEYDIQCVAQEKKEIKEAEEEEDRLQALPPEEKIEIWKEHLEWWNDHLSEVSTKKEKELPNEMIDSIKGDIRELNKEIKQTNPTSVHSVLAHILLHGGAGQGKTALAEIIAKEIGGYYKHQIEFKKCSPSQLKRKKDLDEIMLWVAENPYCVLFIDEIHGLSRVIEESLYPTLEYNSYDITLSDDVEIGDGLSISLNNETGIQTIELPPFTMIGATTLLGEINKPLRDRFPIDIEMADYEPEELEDVIDTFFDSGKPNKFEEYAGQEHAKSLIDMHLRALSFKGKVSINKEAKSMVAGISMRTARLSKQYSKNCIAVAKAENKYVIDLQVVDKMMSLYSIDKDGLNRVHRDIIRVLLEKHRATSPGKKAAIGSQALAEAVGVTKSDIDNVYTPGMTRAGLITRDGRSMKMLTPMAIDKYDKLYI